MMEHLCERGELPGVHIRRALGDVAQGRHLVGTLQPVIVSDEKLQLRAPARRIAPAAAAVEFVFSTE